MGVLFLISTAVIVENSIGQNTGPDICQVSWKYMNNFKSIVFHSQKYMKTERLRALKNSEYELCQFSFYWK